MGDAQTSTFDLTTVQRAMGVRSRIVNPQVSEGIALTVQVGDMSKSFGSQKFEARGVASTTTAATAAEFGYLELHSVAAGGIVIEGIDVDVAAGDGVRFSIQATQIVNATIAAAQRQQVGGQDLTTTLAAGSAAATPSVGAQILTDSATGDRFIDGDLEWFVPSGSFASLFQLTAAVVGSMVMRFREIPQAQGPQ